MPNRINRRDFMQIAGSGALAATSAVALGACGSSGSSTTTTTTASGTGKPKRGGTLNAARIGGTSSDTLDGNAPVETLDLCRVTQLYNTMVALDTQAQVQKVLVEDFIPNTDATVWTMRLRPDVTFHNGKSMTAEDLIYTPTPRIRSPAPRRSPSAMARI